MAENRVRIVMEAEGGQAEKAVDGVRGKLRGLSKDTDAAGRAVRSSFETMKNLAQTTAQAMGDAFGNFFFSNITGRTKSLEESLNQFARSIARSYSNMLGQQMTGSLISGIGGLLSAHGNVFESGRVVPFASGGVISNPTLFPLGLMGEAGPEAILPLRRTRSGDLGVKAEGSGGGGGDVVNVNFTVVANDSRSFKDSMVQNRAVILGVVQDAYNKRGKRGPLA